jgi:hypothetical protein
VDTFKEIVDVEEQQFVKVLLQLVLEEMTCNGVSSSFGREFNQRHVITLRDMKRPKQ